MSNLTPARRAELEAVQRGGRVRHGYAGRWECANGFHCDANQQRALTWLFTNGYIDGTLVRYPDESGKFLRLAITTPKGEKALQTESPTEE